MKAKQRGYYELKTEEGSQWLHFSANCWYNLLEDTGMEADVFGNKLQSEFDKKKPDTLKALNLLTDLAFAAAKAYDQEQDNEITYNRFKVRDWMAGLKETDSAAFIMAMTGASEIPNDGKK